MGEMFSNVKILALESLIKVSLTIFSNPYVLTIALVGPGISKNFELCIG